MQYGSSRLNLGAFLGSGDSMASGLAATDSPLGFVPRICLRDSPTGLHQHPTVGPPIFLRPSIAHHKEYGNINPFSISYGFRPRLRVRLTLGRLTLPRKPWVSANRFFTCFIVTHVSIITSLQSTALCNVASARRERSPTRPHTRNPKLRYHA